MPWTVSFAEEFEPEFDALPKEVQDAILARALLLEREGPMLGRPHARAAPCSGGPMPTP